MTTHYTIFVRRNTKTYNMDLSEFLQSRIEALEKEISRLRSENSRIQSQLRFLEQQSFRN
jgi:chaperonin cofactor prefoldin